MELCGPYTLSRYCFGYSRRRLTEKKARKVFRQVAEGVQAIHHAGFCHRDLKMTNILINKQMEVKIIDFGFAFKNDILINDFCGTPSYVPPELLQGNPHKGMPADIWMMGVILYWLLTGEYAFGAESNKDLKFNIEHVNLEFPYYMSRTTRMFIQEMLRYDPNDRLDIDSVYSKIISAVKEQMV